MLNPRENIVIIDGQIKTSQIARCSISDSGEIYHIAFKNNVSKTFSYKRNRAIWLTNPVIFDPQYCHLYHNDKPLWPVAFIAAFQWGYQKYWYIEYPNGKYANYSGDEISITKSCLEDQSSKNAFEYLRNVAAINPLKSEDDDTPLLLNNIKVLIFLLAKIVLWHLTSTQTNLNYKNILLLH